MACAHIDHDVAIVGAGPAGAAAAIELARAGRRVAIFEKQSFPRRKVCGGCLSGSAVESVRRLLPAGQVLPGTPGASISFIMGACRIACSAGEGNRLVQRSEFDGWLAAAAAAAGAEVRFGCPATLQREAGGWRLQVGGRPVLAHCILMASGLRTLPLCLGIGGRGGARMMGLHWTQPPPDGGPRLGEVHLHWLRGGYVGLAVPEAGCCVVGVACTMAGGHAGHGLDLLRGANPQAPIWSLLAENAPRRCGAIGCAGFPWIPDRLGTDNVLLIGDLAGYAEPFSGEGIGQALVSARCAAQAILDGGPILARYTTLMRKHHGRTVRRTRWLSRAINSPLLRRLSARPAVVPTRLLSRLIHSVHVKGMS